MKNYFRLIICISFFLSLVSCDKKESNFIEKQSFNANWNFKLIEDTLQNKDYSQSKLVTEDWTPVSLPHTPKIEPKIVNDQWQGISWYRKEFALTDSLKSKRLFIKFEAAMNIAEVWVNGLKLIKHQGGYLPFIVDFTDVAKFDQDNSIAVKLDNRDNPITGPKPLETLDFNTYGGLYRKVWLIAKEPLHITDPIGAHKTASGGVFVTYPEVSEQKAKINIKTHISNLQETTAEFQIKQSLIKNDKVVLTQKSTSKTLNAKNDNDFEMQLQLENPNLWSPSYPNLYHLKTEIFQNDVLVDQEITRIGIKTMKFVGQDFYLNGKKTFLRGVNRHQEYPYVGYAISDNANYRDAMKIKEAGFDYVRISHYPHSPAFMDACDELGLITIDAILGWQYFNEDEKFQKHVFQTARDLIRRDRNHASVLAWEVSLNESWMPEVFIDSLTSIAHQEYPGDQCFAAGWQSYGYDIYLQARQHRLDHYDESLKKPYVVSEYGDWEYYAMNAGLSQDSWGDLLQEERSSRQLRSAGEHALLQQATNIQEAHNDNLSTPAFADGYWVMFDYNRGYANDLEASGIMDIFRLPKPSYYFFQSQRDADDPFGKPMLHIANNWQKDSPLNVRIYSNCEEVELFLNGKSLGRQQPDKNRISTNLKHPPFTFSLKSFQAGELLAKAYIADTIVATHKVMTPQQPTSIKIEVDDNYTDLKDEANDLYFVHAYVTDDNGTVIPDFSGEIHFTIEGDAEIIGKNPTHCIAGIASVLIKTGAKIKDVNISAKSKDLQINYKEQDSSKATSYQKETDSLPLIPKLFLEHQSKNKEFCLVTGDTSKKQIALTFDDGPTALTGEILEILKQHNAKATFFWLGKHLQNQKDIIHKAKEEKHLIANHSWDHENGWELSSEYLWQNQVKKAIKVFEQHEAGSPNYYRPPFGAITQEQIEFLASKGIITVLWSLTTMDWDESQNSEDELFDKFKDHIHNGAIVLLHDFDFGNPKGKLNALERMLKYGKSQGYEFVTIANI